MNTFYLLQIDIFNGAALAGLLLSFVILLAVLYFAFRLLKRSVKMAFRMALVAAVLVIALVGGASLWWFGTGAITKPKPAAGKRK